MSRLGHVRRSRGTPPAVTVSLAGGLGNQLFGYAVGLELSRRNNCQLHLQMGTLGSRAFQLAQMDLPEHVSICRPGNPIADHAVRVLGRIPLQKRIFQERAFRFDPRVLTLRPPIRLHGYFQSWRYFPSVSTELRRQISALPTPSERYKKIVEELVDSHGFVALHARRGDYLEADDYHGVTSARYFKNALEVLGAAGKRIAIFSDDDSGWTPAWAPREAIMVRPRDLPDSRETLVLMSQADALAISNSSFAWWAAWVGDRPGRPVICPRPWFSSSHLDTRDLPLLHWLTVDLRPA